jgi:hypothetical protein
MQEQTRGEYRVGTGFNPSNDDMVGQIKRRAADLIDLIDTIKLPDVHDQASARQSNDVARLKALANTAIEEGAMWAVKAATKPKTEIK